MSIELRLLALLAISACGSSQPSQLPLAKAVLPDIPFAEMDHEQQKQFMAERVMPVMTPLFAKHEKLTCATCHGKGAETGKFDMPNGDLPKLNFADLSNFKKEDLEWMEHDIEPAMARAIGRPLDSQSNPTGFGCLGCHPNLLALGPEPGAPLAQ